MGNECILSPEEAIDYLKTHMPEYKADNTLQAHYLNSSQQSVDSLANIVMRITSDAGNPSVILKHVLPYVRAAKENGIDMPLDQNRIYTEVYSLNIWNNIQPGAAPRIYNFDDENYIILMEDLKDMKTLRSELIKRKRYPNFPKQIGQLLGRASFYTSRYYLDRKEKLVLEDHLTHMDTDSFWNSIIFDRILHDATELPINPGAKEAMHKFATNFKVRREVQILRSRFNDKKECLIHKDLHTSNIFISDTEVCIYDSEYAGYGPISFDIGRLVGNILLNIASLQVGDPSDNSARSDYQQYLIQMTEEILEHFSNQFICSWNSHVNGYLNIRDRFLKDAIKEGLGMAACTSICRLFDMSLCFDMKRIDCPDKLATAQCMTILMAEHILMNWERIESPAKVSLCVQNALSYARKTCSI